MAKLKKNNYGQYYCTNCRMIQSEIDDVCEFCGETFSNYEEVLVKMYEDKREDEIKK